MRSRDCMEKLISARRSFSLSPFHLRRCCFSFYISNVPNYMTPQMYPNPHFPYLLPPVSDTNHQRIYGVVVRPGSGEFSKQVPEGKEVAGALHAAQWNASPEDKLSNPTNDVPKAMMATSRQYPQTSIHFYRIPAAVLYFLPPLSTTHTVYLKTKIYNIDPTMSPQLFFWNSHWKQITSALPFSSDCSGWAMLTVAPSVFSVSTVSLKTARGRKDWGGGDWIREEKKNHQQQA